MINLRPSEMFVGSLVVLWVGTLLGSEIRDRRGEMIHSEERILKTLEGAVLTLFGLLLGFMFSMAVGRYEMRRQLIVDEANALATTWLRTSSLPDPVRTQEQQLLRQYLPVRVEFLASDTHMKELNESLRETIDLQDKLWGAAGAYATDHRDAVTALYLTSLNQAIDLSESRTAAFENRIPLVAWLMLLFIGFVSTVVVGISVHSHSHLLRFTLPFVVALALTLTMDLDSPRYGLIKMAQPSLERVARLVQGSPPLDH